jgi:hypothetical protein
LDSDLPLNPGVTLVVKKKISRITCRQEKKSASVVRRHPSVAHHTWSSSTSLISPFTTFRCYLSPLDFCMGRWPVGVSFGLVAAASWGELRPAGKINGTGFGGTILVLAGATSFSGGGAKLQI